MQLVPIKIKIMNIGPERTIRLTWRKFGVFPCKYPVAQTFNFSFRYIDVVLSLTTSRFCDYLHLIYWNEIEVNDTTDTQTSAASYLDLDLQIENGGGL